MSQDPFGSLVSQYLAEVRAIRQVPRVLSEASLYAPLDGLLNGFIQRELPFGGRAVQQARTEFGVPDFVLDAGGTLGFVEAKKPSTDLAAMGPRDRAQQESFLQLPNVLYTNYHDFHLFEDGELVERVSLGGIDTLDYRHPAEPSADLVLRLRALFTRFVSHEIESPRSAAELAHVLARSTRVLHDAVLGALRAAPGGALAGLREEWRELLFEEAGDEEFADAYAQTVAYGLLTARLDFDGVLSVASAVEDLDHRHPFLAAALQLLANAQAREEVGWAFHVVLQTLQCVSEETFQGAKHADDPLLYFYEDFLAEYDKDLRKKRGVYYTPASVVGFQVRAVGELLEDLGRPKLLADDVIALDPAAGTGTYPLALIDETISRVRERDGEGAVAAAASKVARHLNAFELLVGPYTVAHQRLGARLRQLGAGSESVRAYLVDTLAAPELSSHQQLTIGFFEKQLSAERMRADEVKRDVPVRVVLGNPPYERTKGRKAGDWLQGKMSLFSDPVRASARVNLKNLADPYVHFFRWGLWKLFESTAPDGPRILTYISNRSYLGGDWAEGLRLALRQRFDELWIVDLEGESRGAVATENVFDIRVGVAIVVALRRDAGVTKEAEATVRYTRVLGTRAEKEAALKGGLADLEWAAVERQAGAPLLPDSSERWRGWVGLDELMPFRQSGVETKRDALVVAVTPQQVLSRLRAFADPGVTEADRAAMFHVTEARPVPASPQIDRARIRPYGYRPLDHRWLYDDEAFVDRPRPKLHRYWHQGQLAFCTLPKGHGPGPAAVLQTEIPDRHAFRGSFGGHVFPFWLDPAHVEPNLVPGFLRLFRTHLRADVHAADVFAYVFAILNAPAYQPRFADDLRESFPHVPFPIDADVLADGAALGRTVLEAHRLPPPTGRTRLVGEAGRVLEHPAWDGDRLRVSEQGFLEPVTKAAWDYAISGYRVIERWLRGRAGLDLSKDYDLIDQLRRVVEAVETSVRLGPKLDALLARVLDGETLGRRALIPFDLKSAVAGFARIPGALEEAAREADLWQALSDEALLEAERS